MWIYIVLVGGGNGYRPLSSIRILDNCTNCYYASKWIQSVLWRSLKFIMKKTNITLQKMNRDELYRFTGTPDDSIRGIIDEAEEELINLVKPSYVWKIFSILIDEIGVNLVGTEVILKGESIKKHLQGCDRIALLAATLTSETDKIIRKYQACDMTKAVIMDSIASVAIEQVCNKAEEDINDNVKDCYLTYRYGVGYGDFPLEQEKAILDIIESMKNIGLCVTKDNILTPLKSVVCVIGISDTVLEKGQKGCTTCNMNKQCRYRKQGLNCGQ